MPLVRFRFVIVGILFAPCAAAAPFLNYLPAPVDVTPAVAGSFQDVNVSALVPPGATGVLVLYHNPTGAVYSYGLRKKGSTDPFTVDAAKDGQQAFLMTGLDLNRTFQVYTSNTGVKTYLYAYTMGGAVFFDNRIDKSPLTTGAWVDVDVSADTGLTTAIGAIFTVHNSSGNGWQFSLRKNGSTDNRVTDIRADTMALGLIGLDPAEIAEMNVTDATVDLYLVGYVTHGARFFTNALDKSTATEGSYVDVDITANILPGDDANGAILEIDPSNNRRQTALRKNGSGEDLYLEMSKGFGSVAIDAGDIFEQKIQVDDMDIYLVGYSLAVDDCCDLVVTEPANSIRIVGPGEFEMTFHTDAGGGIRELYDLREDPGKTNDLVGSLPITAESEALHNVGMRVTATNYNAGAHVGGDLDLLEATSTRVKVRQETAYEEQGGTILKGVRARGDYSIYPPSKIALRWSRSVTFPVTYQTEYVEQIQHFTQAAAPLDQWLFFGELTGGTPGPPGDDDFVLAAIETPGARMDFLNVLHQQWSAADITNSAINAAGERINLGWVETGGATLDPGAGVIVNTWDLLTTFKPKNLVDHTSAGVLDIRDDYQGPDDLAVTTGGPWLHASENTGGSDNFNEAEAAYALTFDPALGLTFDIDGSAAVPRQKPFFKIRQWRSLADPGSVSLEGAALINDFSYKADVKPASRAHWAANLLLSTTLENPASVDTSPDVGSVGVLQGPPSFALGKHGNGALFDAVGEAVEFANAVTNGDFVLAAGAVEFWFRPELDHTAAGANRLWGYSVDANNFFFLQREAGGDLRFFIQKGAAQTVVVVPAANYTWHAGDFVHIRTTWDETAPLATQARIFLNGREPVHTDPVTPYSSVGMPTTGSIRLGSDSVGNRPARGVIDEFRIYSNAGAPVLLASGGLVSNANEWLATASRNFTLSFDPPDAQRRGDYFYFGADSQFRGLNVALETPGVSVAANLKWEYWNGTGWADLASAGLVDQTNQLTRDGTIYWTGDPSGWSSYTVNGDVELYYVRARLSSGNYSTKPVEAIVKTDILLFQYCGDIVLASQTFNFALPIPTAVELSSFEARGAAEGIEVSWTTATELDNLGFHLHRASSEDGDYERLTNALIPGLGSSPVGASYRYLDREVSPGVTYFYRLEDIETTGRTAWHGPISAEATPTSSPGPGSDAAPSARIAYGDPSQNAFRFLARTARSARIELLTRGFEYEPAEDGSVRIVAPGLEEALEAALPTKRLWMERARIESVREELKRSFSGLRPASATRSELVARSDGIVHPVRRRARGAFPASGWVPGAPARIISDASMGESAKSLLELAPIRFNGASGELVLTERLVVDVVFRGAPPVKRARARGDAASGRVFLVTEDAGLHSIALAEVLGRRRGSLRLSRQEEPKPYHLSSGKLFFLSDGPEANPYGNEAVYELELGLEGPRMGTVDGRPSGGPVLSAFQHTESREENRYYQAALVNAEELWYWDLVLAPATKSFPFQVEGLVLGEAYLRVALQGASDFETEGEHHVRLRVNGVAIAEASWAGKTRKVVTAELSWAGLVEGENVLEIENVGDSAAPYSMVMLDRFEVSYPRLAQGALDGEWKAVGTAEVSGVPSAAAVLDLSHEAPRWLEGFSTDPSGTIRFAVATPGRYLVASEARRPQIRSPRPSRIRSDRKGADWVLIGPQAFLGAATALVSERRAQGLRVLTAPLEEIYDHFGHGEATPHAIRAFLGHAYHEWQRPPRYVLLLGDATYDFKNYLGIEVVNRVPPFVVPTSYLWTASDAAYASVNGEDLFPDLAIGRLPASSAEQVRLMVEKILAFERGEVSGLDAVLVADNPDPGGDFVRNAEELSETVLAGYSQRKIYLSQLGIAETRSEVLAGFDDGASFLSYIGHGGIHLWAQENVFNVDDVPSLSPQERQPLLLTLSCLNGYFHFPYFDSLSEALLKAEGKGVVAALSSSGLTLDQDAHRYHRLVLEELVSGGHERLGDAVARAQARFADAGAAPELLAVFHLLGDPALVVSGRR